MNPEELEFIRLVLSHDGKIPSELWDTLTKRQYYYLGKWTRQGYWEYGVSARSGWLTKAGNAHFKLKALKP